VNAEQAEILGVIEGVKEDKESWLGFLRQLKQRGLEGVRLVISDKCLGLVEALSEVYPEASWQREADRLSLGIWDQAFSIVIVCGFNLCVRFWSAYPPLGDRSSTSTDYSFCADEVSASRFLPLANAASPAARKSSRQRYSVCSLMP
jgi:hypothetical protein